VIRTDRIGDLILSLPVAEAIKKSKRGSRVCYVVSPETLDIARACPFIDSALAYDETAGGIGEMTKLVRSLREHHIDVALYLRPTLRAALAGLTGAVRLRVGTAYRYYSLLFNRRVKEHRKFADKHEVDYNLAIAGAAVEIGEGPYRPRIEVDEDSAAFAEQTLEQRGLEAGNFVIIHPGSGGSARNLPLDRYAGVADMLEGEFRIRVLVTAGTDEAPIVERMNASRNRASAAVIGFGNLLEFAAVIKRSRLFISGSTGPMHIAAAVGTPTLSFFAPVRSCSPRRWGPIGTESIILMAPVPECPTCTGPACEHYDCMASISMDEIRRSLGGLLNR
jgi:ADP-heptose:LPS heptosyltransferase